MNLITFVGSIKDSFQKAGIQLLEVAATRLTAEGVVYVPLRVQDRNGQFDVFLYPGATAQDAAHYAAVELLARQTKGFKPLYYAPKPLPTLSAPISVKVARQDDWFLETVKGDFPKGQYAMWWPTGQENFSTSITMHTLNRIYEGMNGIESYIGASIAKAIGLLEDKNVVRIRLPTNFTYQHACGPEGTPMVVSMSQEKGIRFHFHAKQTSPEYRDLFLKHVAGLVDFWRSQAEERDFDKDEREGEQPIEWWKTTQLVIQNNESQQGSVTQLVGIIDLSK